MRAVRITVVLPADVRRDAGSYASEIAVFNHPKSTYYWGVLEDPTLDGVTQLLARVWAEHFHTICRFPRHIVGLVGSAQTQLSGGDPVHNRDKIYLDSDEEVRVWTMVGGEILLDLLVVVNRGRNGRDNSPEDPRYPYNHLVGFGDAIKLNYVTESESNSESESERPKLMGNRDVDDDDDDYDEGTQVAGRTLRSHDVVGGEPRTPKKRVVAAAEVGSSAKRHRR
jgi:hypothetical protein